MSSRRKARILAFQALYAWDVSSTPLHELLAFHWLDPDKSTNLDEDMRVFSSLMIAGTLENIAQVDAEIKRHLQHWTFERLKRVDLAILRVATYSILFQNDIPAQITIDEAIEIAKEFGAEDSFRFVNGVLDGIWKTHAAGTAVPPEA